MQGDDDKETREKRKKKEEEEEKGKKELLKNDDDEDGSSSSVLVDLWCWCVNLVAEFVAAVLSHPKVSKAVTDSVAGALVMALEHPSTFDKMDEFAGRLTNNMSRHRETAHAIGKDTPQLVSGFVGGLLTNVRKSKTKKNNKNNNNNNDNDDDVYDDDAFDETKKGSKQKKIQ